MNPIISVSSDLKTAVAPAKKGKKDDTSEYQKAHQQFVLFSRAYDSHKEYNEVRKRCDEFYQGKQWADTDLAKLKEEGRPALTINKVFSTVNTVLGEQLETRVDITFKPRKDASAEGAFALTKLTQSICDANQFHWVESSVFADGMIEERGWFDVTMDFSENIFGDIKITSVPPEEIIPDINAKEYDPATWREVWRDQWLSLDEVESTYGREHRVKLETLAAGEQHFGLESMRRVRATFGGDQAAEAYQGDLDQDNREYTTYVRVITRQYYVNTTVYSLVDPETGAMRDLPPGTTQKEAAQLGAQFQAFVHKKTKPKLRHRVSADRFVLFDDWSIYRTATLIPYFPYFRRGKPMGMVRNLLSAQEQLNKLESQELHIINTTANSGYIVEKGALYGMTEDELRTEGAKSGVVITLNPGRMAGFKKIEPNRVPQGIDRAAGKASFNLVEISGVNESMLGTEDSEASGVAQGSKIKRGQVQLGVPLDNLGRTRHLVARKILELIKDFYTEQRVITYTDDSEPDMPVHEMPINQPMSDGSILNNVARGEYDIVIATVPSKDGARDHQLAEALNLRAVGIQIPAYRVIQNTTLRHKDEIAEEMRMLEGLGPTSPEEAEATRRQMELGMQNLEAEVAKKMAAAEELNARAGLNAAKAQEAAAADERHQRDKEFEQVQQRSASETRLQLATLQAINKLDVTELAALLKATTTPQER